MTPLLASAVLLHPRGRRLVLDRGLSSSDAASAATFRSTHLATTFGDAEVTPFNRFPLNSYVTHDPGVDLEAWRLDVSGLVDRPGAYPIDALQRLPKIVQNTRHVCIEGWDAIGNFGGVRLSDLLVFVGAHSDARFVEVACADDYYESIDMASALHPQSLACYEMYGRPLTREHGAPLRLVLPTKLGYKQAKYIVGMRVTSVMAARRGYWEDLGYSWHGGL